MAGLLHSRKPAAWAAGISRQRTGVGAVGGGGGGPGAAGTWGGTLATTAAAAVVPAASTGQPRRRSFPAIRRAALAATPRPASTPPRPMAAAAVPADTGYVLTTAGNFATIAGQVLTGGAGGAGNGNADDRGGTGGDGGGGLLLLQGGTFTNVLGASLIGGAGGLNPSTAGGPISTLNFGGAGLVTSNYVGATFAATVVNAGVMTGGVGGGISATPVRRLGRPQNISGSGGEGAIFNGGGSFTNNATGVITGGQGGPALPAHQRLPQACSRAPAGPVFRCFKAARSPTMDKSGAVREVRARLALQATGFKYRSASFLAPPGEPGVRLFGPTNVAVSLVNNATGIIAGGAGGTAGSGFSLAGRRPRGRRRVPAALASSLARRHPEPWPDFRRIRSKRGGRDGPNQRGGFGFNQVGASGIRLDGFSSQAGSVTVDNRNVITGGNGGAAGASGAGALGGNGADAGVGIEAISSAGPHTIINSGPIAGGNGGAASRDDQWHARRRRAGIRCEATARSRTAPPSAAA